MNKARIFISLCALTSLLAAGCGDDDDDKGGSVTANCQKICALTEPLNCPADPSDCVGYCEMQAAPYAAKCKAQVDAMLACGASKSTSDYECDADGESNTKEGVCEAEFTAVATCALGG